MRLSWELEKENGRMKESVEFAEIRNTLLQQDTAELKERVDAVESRTATLEQDAIRLEAFNDFLKTELLRIEEKLVEIGLNSDNEPVGVSDSGDTRGAEANYDGQTQVGVKCLDGRSLTLEVEPSDTCRNIITKIEEKAGGIPFRGYPDRFSVTDASGSRLITLNAKGSDRFGSIKTKLEDIVGTLSHGQQLICHCTMHIFVKGVRGETFKLNVRLSDTTEDVQAMVHKNTGIPEVNQRLVFAGKTLDGGRTLSDYNVSSVFLYNIQDRYVGMLSPLELTKRS